MGSLTVCRLEALEDDRVQRFKFRSEGVPREGIVLRVKGTLFACENRCRHLPLPLDHGSDGRFLIEGGSIRCASHGATFDLKDGECVRGPCVGARLKVLPVRIERGRVVVDVDD